MKKKTLLGLALLLLSLLLAGCATSLTVSYMVPSEINMGPYRNIAVASTVRDPSFPDPPFFVRTTDNIASRFYGQTFPAWTGRNLSIQVASEATRQITSMLRRTGFFNVTEPEVTDKILDASLVGYDRREAFDRYGVDAVLVPKVEAMNVNEWIWAKETETITKNEDGTEKREKKYTYFYDHQCSMRFSYTLIDAKTEKIIAKKTFTRSTSGTYQIPSEHFKPESPFQDFSEMLRTVMREAENQLVPSTYTFSVYLMDDKTGGAKADTAYEMIADGFPREAERLLEQVWLEKRSVPSAYNAALLKASRGDFDGAILLLSDAEKYGMNRDVIALRARLEEAKKSNERTLDELNKGPLDEKESPSIYDAVRQ